MGEMWFDVPGYGDRYSVSSEGRVMRNKDGSILKPNVQGYADRRTVNLYDPETGESMARAIDDLLEEAIQAAGRPSPSAPKPASRWELRAHRRKVEDDLAARLRSAQELAGE